MKYILLLSLVPLCAQAWDYPQTNPYNDPGLPYPSQPIYAEPYQIEPIPIGGTSSVPQTEVTDPVHGYRLTPFGSMPTFTPGKVDMYYD